MQMIFKDLLETYVINESSLKSRLLQSQTLLANLKEKLSIIKTFGRREYNKESLDEKVKLN